MLTSLQKLQPATNQKGKKKKRMPFGGGGKEERGLAEATKSSNFNLRTVNVALPRVKLSLEGLYCPLLYKAAPCNYNNTSEQVTLWPFRKQRGFDHSLKREASIQNRRWRCPLDLAAMLLS